MLTTVEIDEVKQEVDNKTRQEYHDQETEEEQIPPDPDIPVEPVPQIAETPEATTQIDLNNLINDNNDVSTAWIDYKKAFDSVPHSWILRCLQMYKIHPVLIEFIEQSMNQAVQEPPQTHGNCILSSHQ